MALKLPRLPSAQKLVNSDGTPTLTFSNWWQTLAQKLESVLNQILAIPEIQDALADLDAATAAAQAAADNANAAAQASDDATALANSYPTGLTITATDVGASVTIAISAHNRVYPYATGNVTVAVNAGSLTGQPYSTDIYIHYSDPTRAGGAVTYVASTDPNSLAQVGSVHSVGSVRTPAALAAPSDGNILRPRGYVDP